MPWPRPTTAQQKFEEEEKEALQGKGKGFQFHIIFSFPGTRS
jgi:hypothetical protein